MGTQFTANGVSFGLAGLSLAVMPLGWMLAAGGTTSLLSIVFWLLIGRQAGDSRDRRLRGRLRC